MEKSENIPEIKNLSQQAEKISLLLYLVTEPRFEKLSLYSFG